MNVPFTGGCACGAVRYECTADPVMSINCHCRDCQRASGTSHASGVIVPASGVRFTRGAPKYHHSTADNGNRVARGFCAECGAPIAATQEAFPVYIIYAASLDEPGAHQPTMDIFTASAQPWDHMDPALAKFPKGIGS